MVLTDISDLSNIEIVKLFQNDVRPVLAHARNKRWKKISTVTHRLFVKGIIKEVVGTYEKSKIENLKIGEQMEISFSGGIVKMKRKFDKPNYALVAKYSWFATEEQILNVIKKISFYKVVINDTYN